MPHFLGINSTTTERQKMKTLNALLINPFNNHVQNITLPVEGLEKYYQALSSQNNKVNIVEIVYPQSEILKNHILIIDEEGMLLNSEFQEYFLWEGQFLAGKALIVGDTGDGNFSDCTIHQTDIAANEWLAFLPHDKAAEYASKLDLSPTFTAF